MRYNIFYFYFENFASTGGQSIDTTTRPPKIMAWLLFGGRVTWRVDCRTFKDVYIILGANIGYNSIWKIFAQMTIESAGYDRERKCLCQNIVQISWKYCQHIVNILSTHRQHIVDISSTDDTLMIQWRHFDDILTSSFALSIAICALYRHLRRQFPNANVTNICT